MLVAGAAGEGPALLIAGFAGLLAGSLSMALGEWLSVQSARANAYDEGDLELLSAIANEASIAIQRADLYERTTALSRRLFDLHRLSVELTQHKELGALERAYATSVQELTGAGAVAIYLDPGGDRLESLDVGLDHCPLGGRELAVLRSLGAHDRPQARPRLIVELGENLIEPRRERCAARRRKRHRLPPPARSPRRSPG